MRVPRTISSVGLGGSLFADRVDEPTALHTMKDTEVREFIRKCAVALKSHRRDFHVGQDKEDALSAFESVMALLLDVRDTYPASRADIDQVLVDFGYPVPGN